MVDDLQKDRQIAYTTVLTVMDNPYRKGWLRRTGRAGPWWRSRWAGPAGLTRAPDMTQAPA
jgi:hypothetical protein